MNKERSRSANNYSKFFVAFAFPQQTAYFIAHMMRHIFCNLLDALMKQTFHTNLTRRSSIFNSSYLCHRHFHFLFFSALLSTPCLSFEYLTVYFEGIVIGTIQRTIAGVVRMALRCRWHIGDSPPGRANRRTKPSHRPSGCWLVPDFLRSVASTDITRH